MDYIVHGILQAGILESVAVPFSRGSSQHRDQTQVSHIAGGFYFIYLFYFYQLSHRGSPEYTEELYNKGLNHSDNQNGVVIHLEPDILECEVR